MTRYPSSTNIQTSSSSCAPSSSSRPTKRSCVESLHKEIAELKSRPSTNLESDILFGSPSEHATVLRKETESSPRRNFSSINFSPDFIFSLCPDRGSFLYKGFPLSLYVSKCTNNKSNTSLTQPSDCSDNEESCPPSSNLQSYQLRQITSEEHLHQAMLPHVLFTISPNVLETFEIFEGVDPRPLCCTPLSTLKFHNLRMNLSYPTSSEPIASYISLFLKIIRSCSSTLPEPAKVKFVINGIRPDKLRFVICSDVDTGLSDSFSGVVSHLRKLLPSYHLPYSAYYTIHNLSSYSLSTLSQIPAHSLNSSPVPIHSHP
ncbi:hypothetical protein P9112_009551 [Eukaryota sp. TZLM1-RC]